MMSDAPIHVWLDTERQASHTIVIPYVKSEEPRRIRYNIALMKQNAAGSSMIRQAGSVSLAAGKATSLGALSTNGGSPEDCHLAIELLEKGQSIGRYRFDCPQ